jgi:sodium-dependent dicarboxylate transporter 2/3/5
MPTSDTDRPADDEWFEEPAWLRFPFDRLGLVLGPAVLIGWLLFVDRGNLSPEAHRLAGVMLFTVIWWVTEPIPIAATGILALVLCVVLGAVPATPGDKDPAGILLAPFADPSVFFMLGGLFIGRAMARHGLDRRLALAILCTRWAGRSPTAVLIASGIAVMLISMWISNTAATAMMYPVVLGMISVLAAGNQAGSRRFARSPFASALLLMTAYASSVGGIATPIGTATNIVAIGYFKRPEYFGQTADFLRWSLLGVPLMALIFLGLFAWLRTQAAATGLDMPTLRGYLHAEYEKLGRWRIGEVNTLLVFLLAVALWITPGVLALFGRAEVQKNFAHHFPEAITALLAMVLLFVLPVDWRTRRFTLDVTDLGKVDWGIILLFGAGLGLGSLMSQTGLAKAVGERLFGWLGTNDLWVVTAMAIGAGILLSEITGNAAAASTLLPVILATCREAQMDLVPPLFGVTLGASFGSALPVSTPPNAIVYSSRLLPIRRMILAGIGFDLITGVGIWVALRVAYWLHWTPFLAD